MTINVAPSVRPFNADTELKDLSNRAPTNYSVGSPIPTTHVQIPEIFPETEAGTHEHEIEPANMFPVPDVAIVPPGTADSLTTQPLTAQKEPTMLKRLKSFNSAGNAENIIASEDGGRRTRRRKDI